MTEEQQGQLPREAPKRLEYRHDTGRWEGHDITQGLLMTMSDATFRRYVDELLRVREITKPSDVQRQAACSQCQYLGYWKQVNDPDVSIRRFGKQGGNGDARTANADD